MRLNKKMTLLLRKTIPSVPTRLPKHLAESLKSELQSEKGAIVLGHLRRKSMCRDDDAANLTTFECFVNHIHIDDTRPNYCLLVALRFCQRLNKKLQTFDGTGRYRFIISVDKSGSVLRFHKIRTNDEWLAKDLEKYEDDAVLAFEGNELESNEILRRWEKG